MTISCLTPASLAPIVPTNAVNLPASWHDRPGGRGATMQLTANVLRVECSATTALVLPEFTGSALRGALLGAIRHLFCPAPANTDCAPCPLAGVCPVNRLIATTDADAVRGEEAPRPYVLRPVEAAGRSLAAGEPFTFGMTLIGDAANAFPYVLQALFGMGEAGFGRKDRAPGRFQVERVVALNPCIAAEQTVYQRGRSAVFAPALPINQASISAAVSLWPADNLTLELRSPLRLVAGGALVRQVSMEVLMRRLLRRLTDLSTHFSPEPLQAGFAALLKTAAAVELVDDTTEWLDLESYSGRSGRRTPIGGLTGRLRYRGDLRPLLPYLGWLPVVGLGKDVTKGNGWIEIDGGSRQ